ERLERLPEARKIALAQRSSGRAGSRLLIEEGLDSDGFWRRLIQQGGREKAGDRGRAAGVIDRRHIAPFFKGHQIALALLQRIFRVERGSYGISDFLSRQLIAIQLLMTLKKGAHDDAIPPRAIRANQITKDLHTIGEIECRCCVFIVIHNNRQNASETLFLPCELSSPHSIMSVQRSPRNERGGILVRD